MNNTNIEWCDKSWNPTIGCKHKCSYCYAEELHTMRHEALLKGKKLPECYRKEFTQPQFFPERLKEPYNVKLLEKRNRIAKIIAPDNPVIFVVSMGDLFSEGVKDDWITSVIDICNQNQDKIFMFLTKNPKRYLDFKFSWNCILGTTIDYRYNYKRVGLLKQVPNKKFVSAEPLIDDLSIIDFSGIDFVIVGGLSGDKLYKPKFEFVQSIKHKKIYYKDNILKHLNENQKLLLSHE